MLSGEDYKLLEEARATIIIKGLKNLDPEVLNKIKMDKPLGMLSLSRVIGIESILMKHCLDSKE